MEYGTWPEGKRAAAGCGPPGNNPPTDLRIRYDREQLTWHWSAIATIHEFTHIRDYVKYNSCAPWETPQGRKDIEGVGLPASEEGFHAWVYRRADEEFLNTFGVRAPTDGNYDLTRDHKPLRCLFE